VRSALTLRAKTGLPRCKRDGRSHFRVIRGFFFGRGRRRFAWWFIDNLVRWIDHCKLLIMLLSVEMFESLGFPIVASATARCKAKIASSIARNACACVMAGCPQPV